MHQVFLGHFARYPLMTPQDCVKLAYQSTFGGGHLVGNPQDFLHRLQAELESCPSLPHQPLLEDIGGGYQRLYLSSKLCKAISPATISFLFSQGAKAEPEEKRAIEGAVDDLKSLTASGLAPFSSQALEAFLIGYKKNGYPALHHSSLYRDAYQPAYRVMDASLLRFLPLFQAIDDLLTQGRPTVVAIDGMAAAGKSTLASLLARRYDCPVIHMDDFFLPPALRTPERLATPGGNVHYERFQSQILESLGSGKPFRYEVFDCHTMSVTHEVSISPAPLTVIEGAYALHPALRAAYDLKVFYRVEPGEQLRRIAQRNGEGCVPAFRDKWIPLENTYALACKVRECCDLIL